MLLLWLVVGVGCGDSVPNDSACRNLTYTDRGVARAEYLPCAGEIMAALDVLDSQTRAALNGDGSARAKGIATLAEVKALMSAAGGRKLLERWDDRALTDLNVGINNAVTHYQAFYMVRILDESKPYAAESRRAAEAEEQGARRRYEQARAAFRQLQ